MSIQYITVRITVSGTAALDGTTLFMLTPNDAVVDSEGILNYTIAGPVGVFDLSDIVGEYNFPFVLQGLSVENTVNPHAAGVNVGIQSTPVQNNPATRKNAFAFSLAGTNGIKPQVNYLVPVDHRITIDTSAEGTPGPHTIQFSIARSTDSLLNSLLDDNENDIVQPSQWIDPVRVASTVSENLTTLAPGDVIDGVTVRSGDSVLLKNQGLGAQNGVYIIQDTAPPARREDFNAASGEVSSGLTVSVQEGTSQASTIWTLATANPILVRTTALSFVQTGGPTVGDPHVVWIRHEWNVATNGTSLHYLPMDGSVPAFGITTITDNAVRAFFPEAMRLRSIAVWAETGGSTGSTVFGLHVDNNTTPVKTVTLNISAADTRFLFDFGVGGFPETVGNQFVAVSCDPTTGAILRAITYWEPRP